MNKAVNLLGWLGTALVCIALVRCGSSREARVDASTRWTPRWRAWSGRSLYIGVAVARHRAGVLSAGRRGSARSPPSSVVRGARHPRRRQLPRVAAEQALGPDREQAVQRCRTRRSKILQKLDAPVKFLVFDKATELRHVPRSARRVPVRCRTEVTVEYINPDKEPVRAKQNQVAVVRHRRLQVQGPHRARGRHRRAGAHQRPDQGGERRAAQGLLHAGPRRAGHREQRARRLQRHLAGARRGELQGREARARAEARGARRRHGAGRRGPEDRLPAAARSTRSSSTSIAAASCSSCSTRRTRPARPLHEPRSRLLKDWGIEVGNDIVVDASGIGQLLGTDESVPVAARYPSHPITERLPA